jgi:reactive chlorine resistance protein C
MATSTIALPAPDAAARFTTAGTRVLRYGLVALLVLFGALKFTEMEALGIQPLVGNHPLMSWMYSVLGLRGTSAVIGVVELAAAALMLARPWRPRWSALGSILAVGTFAVTLSFLVTTPGALEPDSAIGGFLMKDLILFGAALYTAGEALAASKRSVS